jgi:hypothetical protein
MAPTTDELKMLADRVRKLEDQKSIAFNMREMSTELFLEHAIIQRQWAMASNHLGDRIREYIESGQSGMVRP